MSARLLNVARRFVNLWRSMTNKARKLIIGVPLTAIFILVGWLVFDELHRVTPPPPPVPNPNGYDDFAEAGKLLADAPYLPDLDPQQWREQVLRNSEALKLARLGLSRECLVPITNSTDFMDVHMPVLASIKRIAIAFDGEGKVAEMENRPDDAAKSYLDCIRLGRESVRGGVWIDKLVGIACEAIGMKSLKQLSAKLDAKNCREAVTILETLESKSDSIEVVLRNEKRWVRRTYGWRERFGEMIRRLIYFKSTRLEDQKFVAKIQTREKEFRVLMLDLAARAYELEKGERPKTIRELVPNYLKTIPLDPLTGTNMVYQP